MKHLPEITSEISLNSAWNQPTRGFGARGCGQWGKAAELAAYQARDGEVVFVEGDRNLVDLKIKHIENPRKTMGKP